MNKLGGAVVDVLVVLWLKNVAGAGVHSGEKDDRSGQKVGESQVCFVDSLASLKLWRFEHHYERDCVHRGDEDTGSRVKDHGHVHVGNAPNARVKKVIFVSSFFKVILPRFYLQIKT